MKKIFSILSIFALSFFLFSTEWLHLGPIQEQSPQVLKGKDAQEEVLNSGLGILPFSPVEGKEVEIYNGRNLKWEKVKGKISGTETLSLHFFAIYLSLNKWVNIPIKIESPHPFVAFLDGKLIGKAGGEPLEKKELLEPGKHSLVIKLLYDPKKGEGISLKLNAKGTELSFNPRRPLSLREIMNLERISGILVSPCGKFVSLGLNKWNYDGKRENWVEIIRLKDKKVIRSFRGLKISSFLWRPHSCQFSYIIRNKDKASIWISGMSGDTKKIVEEKDLGSYSWSKDGEFIVYYIVKKGKEFDNNGLKRVKNPPDRQKGFRRTYKIYQIFPDTGFKRILGITKSYPAAISPDGKNILMEREIFDRTKRPYSIVKFSLLELKNLKEKELIKEPWVNYGVWSPDSKKLLFVGGPSAFGGAGNVLPKGRIPNEYDNQAYIYDFKTGKVEVITKNFKPSLNNVVWADDGNIYFTAEDKTFVHLYKYNPVEKKISLLPSGAEVVRGLDIGESGLISYIGTGTNFPKRAYVIKPGESKPFFVYFPAAKEYSTVNFGKIEDWDTKVGKFMLKGRIYYPPNFDPHEKYPLIIYYYGGTSPITRDFDGRYPKEWWASKGYVVYTMVPAGSTGFGEEFSSYHVNDWGKLAGKQIINASKKFMKTHSFVGKVGIIGASFGGFMTQYLITKTSIYACAVSHAGINLIPHYWGEGYWGYTYNAISAAFSFPWNRKDLYVNQSPLFFADRIKTPLLLLHGTSDTNVPPGESDQMFTALKLLGSPVELVKIKGENHWIMGYKHRIGWYKAIIGWFDKWLKGDPTLWNSMFKEK